MSEPNATPTPESTSGPKPEAQTRPGPRPGAPFPGRPGGPGAASPGPRRAGPSGPEQERIDEAMEEAMARERKPAPPEVPLKRQWDDALEAELEAALSGLDPKTFDVAKQRPPKQATGDRLQVDQRDRGQEARKGPRIGKVIVARGKSLFIDLGGKS